MFSISGLASGLDTDNMISQLLQAERMPVRRLEQHQRALNKVDDAWGTVTKRLSSLRTAIDSVTKGSSFADRWKTTSSNDTAATAKVTGTPDPGSTTFTVTQLAAVQSHHSQNGVAESASLVGAGTITLTRSDGTELGSITTDGSTTLTDLKRDLASVAGIEASIVKKGDGDHRLVLASEETGTANGFSVAYSDNTSDLATTLGTFSGIDAKNAELSVGSLAVTRSSNTVTDLIDGVTLSLKDLGTTTVTTSQDVDGAAADVKKVVSEINAMLSKLADLTAYDPETKKAGPLQGDATARRLTDHLRRGVIDVVGGISGTTSAGAVGITMNRDGGFDVDETKLKAAIADDPAAMDRLLQRSASSTLGGVEYASSKTVTKPDDYDVTVSQVAKVARLTGASYTQPANTPETFTITARDGTAVTVTVPVGANAEAAAQTIRDALAEANVTSISAEAVTLADGSAALELSEGRYGASYGFEVSGGGGVGLADGIYTGQDVAGTIDGQAATGRGQRLSLSSDSSGADGLALTVTMDALPADPDPATGTVTVSTGIVGRLDQIMARYEGSSGAIQGARTGIESNVKLYQDRIDAFDRRIEQREVTLRRQFAAMESAMAQLSEQGNWLSSQLAGLQAQTQ